MPRTLAVTGTTLLTLVLDVLTGTTQLPTPTTTSVRASPVTRKNNKKVLNNSIIALLEVYKLSQLFQPPSGNTLPGLIEHLVNIN